MASITSLPQGCYRHRVYQNSLGKQGTRGPPDLARMAQDAPCAPHNKIPRVEYLAAIYGNLSPTEQLSL